MGWMNSCRDLRAPHAHGASPSFMQRNLEEKFERDRKAKEFCLYCCRCRYVDPSLSRGGTGELCQLRSGGAVGGTVLGSVPGLHFGGVAAQTWPKRAQAPRGVGAATAIRARAWAELESEQGEDSN